MGPPRRPIHLQKTSTHPGSEQRSAHGGAGYRSLEEEEQALEGEEKIKFLVFLRRMLQWRPEDRLTARELIGDPWLKIE